MLRVHGRTKAVFWPRKVFEHGWLYAVKYRDVYVSGETWMALCPEAQGCARGTLYRDNFMYLSTKLFRLRQ